MVKWNNFDTLASYEEIKKVRITYNYDFNNNAPFTKFGTILLMIFGLL